jgi:hypothetical protein
VDLIIPTWWTGTLELINPGTGESQLHKLDPPDLPPTIPLVVLPFNSQSSVLGRLNTRIDKSGFVSLPNLDIKSSDPLAPVFFLGNRGGKYRSISMNAVTGMFSGRSMSFAPDSRVSISIPQGDIVLNTDNPITTDLVSLYAATRPVVLDIFPVQQPVAGVTSFLVSLVGINFRNLNPGDINLSFRRIATDVPIPDAPIPLDKSDVPVPKCRLTSHANAINTVGSLNQEKLVFTCSASFTRALSNVQYSMFLNYFGGAMSLLRSFQVSVTITNSVVTLSNLLILSTNSSALPKASSNPNSMCAVGAQASSSSNTLTTSGFVPSQTPVILKNQSILISFPPTASGSIVTFSCQAARSLSVGSHPYSYGNKPNPQSLLGTFLIHESQILISFAEIFKQNYL